MPVVCKNGVCKMVRNQRARHQVSNRSQQFTPANSILAPGQQVSASPGLNVSVNGQSLANRMNNVQQQQQQQQAQSKLQEYLQSPIAQQVIQMLQQSGGVPEGLGLDPEVTAGLNGFYKFIQSSNTQGNGFQSQRSRRINDYEPPQNGWGSIWGSQQQEAPMPIQPQEPIQPQNPIYPQPLIPQSDPRNSGINYQEGMHLPDFGGMSSNQRVDLFRNSSNLPQSYVDQLFNRNKGNMTAQQYAPALGPTVLGSVNGRAFGR